MPVGTVWSNAARNRFALAVAAYVILSLADMALSSVSFVIGVGEANPLLAWAGRSHLFIPAKLLLTGLIAWLLVWLYPRRFAKYTAWLAVLLMATVVAYHLWGLHAVLSG
jgi:hypothetical protein